MIDQEKYYQKAREASAQIGTHPGLKMLQKLAADSKNVLDVGCGEGTRLNLYLKKNQTGTGIDLNQYALKEAQKQYPRHHFTWYDGQTIPFADVSFDLVYSAFVLEHTQDPENFVREMIRVTGKGGRTVILCPNYGAPNRRSPVSSEKPLQKLFSGYLRDLSYFSTKLTFTKVTPRKVFKEIDDDTTCEPYLHDLIKFLRQFPSLKIVRATSLWEIDDNALSLHQRIFKKLGLWKIYPFKFWGPQLFIVLQKR